MNGVFLYVIEKSGNAGDQDHHCDSGYSCQQKERPPARFSVVVANVTMACGSGTAFQMFAHAFSNASPSSKRMSPTGTSACCFRRHQKRNAMVLPTATNAVKSIQLRLR